MKELEGQLFGVFISSAKSGPGFNPCRHEMRVDVCLIGIQELEGNGVYCVQNILRMGLDVVDVWLNVDDVFGADVTLGLDRLDMKGSRDIVCVVTLGLVGERFNVRVNIETISGHDCVLVVGLESVLVECVHILCCVDDVDL